MQDVQVNGRSRSMIRALLVLALVAATLGASAALAGPAKKPGGSSGDPEPAEAEKYTKESLTKQLKEMGYEAAIDDESVSLVHKREGEENTLFFTFGEYNVFLGCSVVGKIKDADKIGAGVWATLLRLNHDLGPMHLTLVPKDEMLVLYRGMSLRPIPNQKLDEFVSSFVSAMKKHEAAWSAEVLPEAEAK